MKKDSKTRRRLISILSKSKDQEGIFKQIARQNNHIDWYLSSDLNSHIQNPSASYAHYSMVKKTPRQFQTPRKSQLNQSVNSPLMTEFSVASPAVWVRNRKMIRLPPVTFGNKTEPVVEIAFTYAPMKQPTEPLSVSKKQSPRKQQSPRLQTKAHFNSIKTRTEPIIIFKDIKGWINSEDDPGIDQLISSDIL